jgi:hypothetical protein
MGTDRASLPCPHVEENAETVRLTLEFIDSLNDVAGIHAMAVMGIADA